MEIKNGYLKAKTGRTEWTNTDHYTVFKIVDSRPEAGDLIYEQGGVERERIKSVREISLDTEAYNDDRSNEYEYYKTVTVFEERESQSEEWTEVEEGYMYFAVESQENE